MSLPADYFDQMYASNDDPWQMRTRWYEQRKRAITLATLPAARYANGFEPGCANGELAADLATRCDHLLVCDMQPAAVAAARRRLSGNPHVRVEQRSVPADWPQERFDLIVISELAYYLAPASLVHLACQASASLVPGGTLLACHWRHPIDGCAVDGDTAHHILNSHCGLHPLVHHAEDDFVIDTWSSDSRSVGRLEGLA